VSGFEYRGFLERQCTLQIFCSTKELYKPVPAISQYGDKTVMTQSAEGYGGVKKSFYLNLKEILDTKKDEAVEHYDITENSSTQHIIESILKNSTSTRICFYNNSNELCE